MSETSGETRFRWECVYCDTTSEETFDTRQAARDAGLAHIDDASHGLTTILTPEVGGEER